MSYKQREIFKIVTCKAGRIALCDSIFCKDSKKVSQISVHFALSGFVGSEEEICRGFGKSAFSGGVGIEGKATAGKAAVSIRSIVRNGERPAPMPKFAVSKSKILPQYQISLIAHFVLTGILLGSAFPKPCFCCFRRLSRRCHAATKGGHRSCQNDTTPRTAAA